MPHACDGGRLLKLSIFVIILLDNNIILIIVIMLSTYTYISVATAEIKQRFQKEKLPKKGRTDAFRSHIICCKYFTFNTYLWYLNNFTQYTLALTRRSKTRIWINKWNIRVLIYVIRKRTFVFIQDENCTLAGFCQLFWNTTDCFEH